MTDDEIKQGIAICEKATRSEWFVGHLGRDDHKCDCRYIFDENHMGAIAEVCVEDGENDCPPKEEAVANMDLIAFFGTHGLALLRELEKERARNEELVKENEQVAQFTGGCVARGGELLEAMRTVRAHTAFNPGAPYDLLVGLLGSIERIADKALLSPRLEDRKETTP